METSNSRSLRGQCEERCPLFRFNLGVDNMGDAITNNELEQNQNPWRGKANVDVSNPYHYAGDDGIIEPIDRIGTVQFNFGSAFKYLKRVGLKGGDNTEARDAGSAVWYAVDIAHRLLAEDDFEFVPTPELLSDFSVEDFIESVGAHAAEVESKLGMRFASEPQKRFVLAAMDWQISRAESAIKVGMSDKQYREFVLDVLVTSYYVRNYGMTYANETGVNYVGSKSFPLSRALQKVYRVVTAELEAKFPVILAAQHHWLDGPGLQV